MRSLRLLSAALTAVIAMAASGCGSHTVNATGYLVGTLAARAVSQHNAKLFGTGARKLFVLPDSGNTILADAINSARKVIRLEIYMLTEQTVLDALIAAHNRGVDVEVMLEPRPYNPSNPNMPLPVNHKAFNALAAAGVKVGNTNPAFTYTHAKFMSIDDATTVVSTANFTKSGLNNNREYIILDQDAGDVSEFVRIFQADQARQVYQPTQADGVVSPSNSRQHIFDLIKSAKHDITIADEVAGDAALDDLLKAKVAQGVHVRALLGAMKPTPKDPTPLNVQTAQKWTAAGVQVRFQSVPVLHAKSIVVDGSAMYVGSENLTTNSLDHNREVGLLLSDPSLVAPVVAATNADWQNAAPALAARASVSLSEAMNPVEFDF